MGSGVLSEFECPFQHHTDTSKYMDNYRRTKINKIHEAFSDDIRELLSQDQPEAYHHETVPGSTRSMNVYIPSPVGKEEYPLTYRLEDLKNNNETLK